jgi:CRISPR type III-A-associated protein Csm2
MYERNERNYVKYEREGMVKKMTEYIENGGGTDFTSLFKNGGTIYEFTKGEKSKISQLRKFYDDLIKIKNDKIDSYRLMRIELNAAYAKGRKEYISEEMYKFINDAVGIVLKDTSKQDERLSRFKNVFEAIIAYHALVNRSDRNGP